MSQSSTPRELHSHADLPTPVYGRDLWQWPTLTLLRSSDGFHVYNSSIHHCPNEEPPASGHQTEDPYQIVGDDARCDASEAWYRLLSCDMDDESVSIMVGPGEHPVSFRNAFFHPQLYSVWKVDDSGQAMLLGYFPPDEAKHKAKSLHNRGESFAITTSYLWNDGGWDDEPTEDPTTQLSPRDIEHLLTLARAGRSKEASGAEKQARRIVKCLLDNTIGLDASATSGINRLIATIQANPMSGRAAVREVIR